MDMLINLFKRNYFTNEQIQYYNIFTKCLYIIKKNESSLFTLYYYRLFICFGGCIIATALNVIPIIYCILIAFLVYLYLTYYFYKQLLPRYETIPSFDIQTLRLEYARTINRSNDQMQCILLFLFGVLLLINTYFMNGELYNTLLSIGIALFCISIAIKKAITK